MSEFVITINNKKRRIKIIDDETLLIDSKRFNFELMKLSNGISILRIDNRVYEVSAESTNEGTFNLFVEGRIFETMSRTSLEEKASNLLEKAEALHTHRVVVKAPMPGMILKIKKKTGDSIKKGESVIILEAMKMENEIKAPVSGTITELNVIETHKVDKNSFLFSIE